MATLERIRNRSGLLLAVIGLAMLAFILTDFMSSLGSGGGGSIYVGEVLGEDVMRQDYELKVEEGINNWKSQNQQSLLTQTIIGQIRSQIWNQYVRDLVMNNEYEKLGIDVSDDEFWELLQGINVHPEISKVPAFQDENTGFFDRTKVVGYLKQIDQDPTGEARTRWVGFQRYLIGLIKTSKYNALVAKAMYATNKDVTVNVNEDSQNVTFNYVEIPFSSISDSLFFPTESEIKTYYKNQKENYQQDASKDVDFVVFTVIPSIDDSDATRLSLENLKTDFSIYEDYDLMARRNSDNTAALFTFTTQDALQDPNWTELFTAEEGTVIGPYESSQGVYRIAKLAIAQNRPDSVEARHILIKPTQTMNIDSVNARIKTIKKQVEAGANFGTLAQKNSEDQGSAIKGGDLGWFQEGAMVDEFNEVCFTSRIGDLTVVTSQFGVHLIEVTKRSKEVRKVKIAFIDRNIEPSTATFNAYYSEAAQFAGKILNEGIVFDSLVVKENLVKRSDSKVTADKQSIVGLPNSREMVRWMNTADEGTVSEVFQFGNSYVVAYLQREYDAGFIPLTDIKEKISSLVLKEKKARYISASITASNLKVIAANNGQIVISEKTANLANLNIQGIGYEPELVGAIFGTTVGSISRPIKAKNAVYIVEVTAKDEVRDSGDFHQQKQAVQKDAAVYANGAAYKVLNNEAEVKDNRSDFY
ncbi:peptidylprolyl isomerase [Flavobacteriales bacterium]|nr:peptidylprolyl isomerase [Flavobacteriales bacterium]